MKRRQFIAGVGAAAAVGPRSAWGQSIPTVGFLHSASPETVRYLVAGFQQGLKETEYTEGANVLIEYAWAEGHPDRLPSLAANLVSKKVSVIFASGGAVPALTAKAASSTIPVVFVTGSDPLKVGLIESYNRPGANVTGVSFFSGALEPKRLELLRELLPKALEIAVLVNPNATTAEFRVPEMQEGAHALGLRLRVLTAATEDDLDEVFVKLAQRRADALLVTADPFYSAERDKLIALADKYAVPTIYDTREAAAAGGLMSYGASIVDAYRLGGVYVGRVLKGAKPSDLPVQMSVKVELALNLKTAKRLGLAIPITVLGRADEVIE